VSSLPRDWIHRLRHRQRTDHRGTQVLGLARSEAAAASLAAQGRCTPRFARRSRDPAQRRGRCGGVIHTAFIHDFSKFKDNCETDRHAVEALGAALVGSDRP